MRLIFKVKKFCLKPSAPKLRLSAEETSVHALNDRQKQGVAALRPIGSDRANGPRRTCQFTPAFS